MYAIQRDVVLLFAAFVSRQDGVIDEAQSERMRMPGNAKTSHKLDCKQEQCHAAARRTNGDSRIGMERSIQHAFVLPMRTAKPLQRFPWLISPRQAGS